jgi:hypothetical protein
MFLIYVMISNCVGEEGYEDISSLKISEGGGKGQGRGAGDQVRIGQLHPAIYCHTVQCSELQKK